MARFWFALPFCLFVGSAFGPDAGAADPKTPVRGVFVKPERLTPEFLAGWKAKGATAVVVVLDEDAKRRWTTIAESVECAGLTLWPWIEVARNPAMADAHPDWMAATGGHHDDWRRRFPKAPTAKGGEVVKAWPWVPIGYAPAFDAHRERLHVALDGIARQVGGRVLERPSSRPVVVRLRQRSVPLGARLRHAPTASRTPGDDAAAKLVARSSQAIPGNRSSRSGLPSARCDFPGAKNGTGLCGGVACAKNDCWPRYARAWNPLIEATNGPLALALWPQTFRRDPARWIETAVPLFQKPLRGR